MRPGDLALDALAWLFTYAVHSTLLLGAAWALARRVRGEAWREWVWKTALVGGVVTASLQTGLGLEPGTGRFELSAAPALDGAPRSALAPFGASAAASLALLEPARDARHARGASVLLAGPAREPGLPWTHVALALWILGGLAVFALLVPASRRLRDRLAGRRPLDRGPLPAALERLRRSAGVRRKVRLCVSPRLRAPIAMGVAAPQICLPERALVELTPAQQEAMLAHELAHIARFDPLWLGLCRWLETLFFFQPLNALARRRLADSAEFLCDAWAVRATQSRLALARCLASVAGWIAGGPERLPVCGMAHARSRLSARVERILNAPLEERAPRWSAALALGAIGSALLWLPGVAWASDAARTERAGDAAAETAAPVASGAPAPPAAVEPARAEPDGASPSRALSRLSSDLDRQLETLERELAALREELAGRDAPAQLRERLELIEQRARAVRERKETLHALLDPVLESLAAGVAIDRRKTPPNTRKDAR